MSLSESKNNSDSENSDSETDVGSYEYELDRKDELESLVRCVVGHEILKGNEPKLIDNVMNFLYIKTTRYSSYSDNVGVTKDDLVETIKKCQNCQEPFFFIEENDYNKSSDRFCINCEKNEIKECCGDGCGSVLGIDVDEYQFCEECGDGYCQYGEYYCEMYNMICIDWDDDVYYCNGCIKPIIRGIRNFKKDNPRKRYCKLNLKTDEISKL